MVTTVLVIMLWLDRSGSRDETWSRLLSRSHAAQEPAFVGLHGDIPETTWIKGVAGFNYFHNLYFVKGTFLAVTSQPETFPPQGVGYFMSAEPGADDDGINHPPAGPDMWRTISPKDARSLLGDVAVRKSGISMFFNDQSGIKTPSFLDHYFHCEMFLGAWRLVAAGGESELPARLMYRTTPKDWRDRAGLTPWFQQSVLPTTAIEEHTIFEDRTKSGMTFLYDRITIIDRWAAHRYSQETAQWNKATADLPLLDVPKEWLYPLRDSLKRLVMTEGCSIQRQKPNVPIVTYINRQLTGRRLNSQDNEALLDAMKALDAQGIIEFNDAKMETVSRTQQFCMALRTDIMIGVHGNGLSHQLWMKPNSGVLEFMDVGGFARDYAVLADLAQHEYYSIHNDVIFPPSKWRKADGWAVDISPGFHGSDIRVDATFISSLVKKMAEARRGVREPALSV